MPLQRRRTSLSAALLLAASALAGCTGQEPPVGPGDGGTPGPLYAIASSVFGTQDPMTYVNVLSTLDVTALDRSKASEHAGFATIGAVEGTLFVASGSDPTLTRYTVADDGSVTQNGKLSFANYGLSTAPLYRNVIAGSSAAYMHLGETDRVVWDPKEFVIRGTASTPGLATSQGPLQVRAAWDRGIAVRGGEVFQPFYWTDADYYRFHRTSQIAIYAQATNTLVGLVDAPCPGLDAVTRDEAGNLYFSNWVFPVAGALLDDSAPETCAVRIKAGERVLDAAWTRSFSQLVGGRQTAAFRYLANGVGTVAVLHDEELTPAERADPRAVANGSRWRLWRVDLNANTAAPVEGLDWMGGGYYAFNLSGRTFLLLPSADYAKTTVYELPATGAAVRRFETTGWAYQFIQVR
jgi:hypothetical protein